MFIVTLVSFGLQLYTLSYLPLADCLPFKKGNNINEKMKIPAGARPDSFAIRFIYQKAGREFEFAPAELPPDLATYTFVKREDKLIRKGNAEPPIKGFALTTMHDIDSTQAILSLDWVVLLFVENFDNAKKGWRSGFAEVYKIANTKNIPGFIVTAQPDKGSANIAGTEFSDIAILKCDHTAIKTAARSNPAIYLLKKGVVAGKWSFSEFKKAEKEINRIAVQNALPIDPGIGGDTSNY